MPRSLVLAVPFLVSACATVPVGTAPAPVTIDPARLASHVQTLSSDAFEGRGPATAAEPKVIDYVVGQYRAAGLEPGGDLKTDGTREWTQKVPLLKSEHASAPDVSLCFSGTCRKLTQGEQISVRSPMNGQKEVNFDGLPLLFVGYGTSAPERGWDDFKGVDVKGKLLVELVNDPDFEGAATDPMRGDFGGKAMTYYGRWTYKYEEAARRGAAGVLVIHEDAPASYGWATVKNSNTNTMLDIVRNDPAAAHTAFESWITRDTAVDLFKASGLDFEAMKAAARRKDFKPVPLAPTLNARIRANTETIVSHNIVGLLKGATHPDETILYTGHWDHLGIGAPDARGDKVYNGAVDNATGIAALIEQARAFASGPRPQRSIVFMAVTAEEKGLLGSAYYADNPLYPIGKTVGVLNTDAIGWMGPTRDFGISGTARLDLLDLLIAEAGKVGRTYVPDSRPETGGFFRSDHFPFAKAGVPAISFGSGRDLIDGGTAKSQLLAAAYTKDKYHQPADEYDPALFDLRGLANDISLLHTVGQILANGRMWPNWSADSEFRAARDATEGDRK